MVSFFSVISGRVFLGLTSPANGGDQHQYEMVKPTVNSEIFARTLFLQNFSYAKFRENKPYGNGKITLSFIDIGKSCLSRKLITSLV